MLSPSRCFSIDYAQAAARFCRAAQDAGYKMSTMPYKCLSRTGGSLYVDIARKGPVDASRIIVTTSGTHGIEGFAGSAIQLSSLANNLFDPLPPDMAILHVHALNPHGFSHLSRTDEMNIDVNRNFVDWVGDNVPADPPLTAFVQPMFHPAEWQWPIPELKQFLQTTKKEIRERAIAGGQYSFMMGLFFGGYGPSQSNVIWHDIIEGYLSNATDIGHIDFHTGLGPYGHGELIVPAKPGDPMLKRARLWWGDQAKSPFDGTSAAGKITGFMNGALDILKPNARVVSAALEFGTYEPDIVLEALAFDNYVSARPLRPGNLKEYWRAKDMMQKAFCPPDREWKQKVVERGNEVLLSVQDALVYPYKHAPE